MRKRLLVLIGFLVLSTGVPAYCWQGRMGGMADPSGLISDESDFLIHPAKIAGGEGIRFYGDYRFTHTGVTDWDDQYVSYTPAGTLASLQRTDVSGEERVHNGLLGASFSLGQGRMGLFFTYNGMTADYDGRAVGGGPKLEMKNDLSHLALRFLYGLPIGSAKLGAETLIAYRREKDELISYSSTGASLNNWWVPYKFPHTSRYWEALFKGSVDGKVGSLDVEFTLKGGFDFAGADKWSSELQMPLGTPFSGHDARGDVQGWQIGSDLWLRYPLTQDLTAPFLVRLDYQAKERDGDGPELGAEGGRFAYRDEKKNLAITVGGGVDKELGKRARIAVGIYYNYLQEKEDLSSTSIIPGRWTMNGETYPDSVEHRVLLRLAGEYTLSSAAVLRSGLNFFYGWVDPKVKYSTRGSAGDFSSEDLSGDACSHWGVRGSLGGTVKIKAITLEPFVGGGYEQLRLSAQGVNLIGGGTYLVSNEKFTRNEWFVSTGFSVLFGL